MHSFGYNSQVKRFRTHVDIDIVSCFGMWNSCPEFVRTFQLVVHPVCIEWEDNWRIGNGLERYYLGEDSEYSLEQWFSNFFGSRRTVKRIKNFWRTSCNIF
jgi:hypothetical protein